MRIRISADFSVRVEFIGNGVIRWFDGETSRYLDFDRKQSARFLRMLRQEP